MVAPTARRKRKVRAGKKTLVGKVHTVSATRLIERELRRHKPDEPMETMRVTSLERTLLVRIRALIQGGTLRDDAIERLGYKFLILNGHIDVKFLESAGLTRHHQV